MSISQLEYESDYVFNYIARDKINQIINAFNSDAPLNNIVVVSTAEELSGTLSSDKVYLVDGIIDFTGTGFNIEVPAGGLSLIGQTFDVSGLICSDDNYDLFTSPFGGSGNLLLQDLKLSTTGTNSQVFNLVANTGNEALEFEAINYEFCSSLGIIDSYRQLLETGTGRIGGTPEMTFEGSWDGARITTSIVLFPNNVTAIFKKGNSLTFTGRFITDINCNLPAVGALFDFDETNIVNEESLIVKGAFVRREGVIDTSDPNISPNIDETSVKSLWSDNTGIPNTYKYIKGTITAEAPTTATLQNVYYPLEGTVTLERNSHFDSPANGEYRLLSGNGVYQVTGDISVDAPQNDVIDIRVTKSTDGGTTFPEVINHIGRVVNNLSGGRDVAFFPINFLAELKKDDILRVEIENKSQAGSTLTAELDSYLSIIAL